MNYIVLRVRTYFAAGLIIIVPLAVTFYIAWWLIDIFDHLKSQFIPNEFIDIPGLGLILFIIIVLFMGWLFTTFLGRFFVRAYENILERLPFLNTLYNVVKQISEAIFFKNKQAFSEAVLIEYPRKGIYTIAFVTATPNDIIKTCLPSPDYIMVYVPTTPNPTSGFALFVHKDDIRPLAMPVDQAIKTVISLGIAEQ